jgi:hypothetical protein
MCVTQFARLVSLVSWQWMDCERSELGFPTQKLCASKPFPGQAALKPVQFRIPRSGRLNRETVMAKKVTQHPGSEGNFDIVKGNKATSEPRSNKQWERRSGSPCRTSCSLSPTR